MNIKCTQNIYKSANGVSNVTYYIMVPEEVEIHGIVQLSHGMSNIFRATPRSPNICAVSGLLSAATTILATALRFHARLISAFLQCATAGSILSRMSSS